MSNSMDQKTQEKISQLQLFEQSIQEFSLQKQNLQSQLLEIDAALKELEITKAAYKIVGNIMVSSDTESLKKELNEQKETTFLRIKSIEKQENSLREKAKEKQSEILSELKK